MTCRHVRSKQDLPANRSCNCSECAHESDSQVSAMTGHCKSCRHVHGVSIRVKNTRLAQKLRQQSTGCRVCAVRPHSDTQDFLTTMTRHTVMHTQAPTAELDVVCASFTAFAVCPDCHMDGSAWSGFTGTHACMRVHTRMHTDHLLGGRHPSSSRCPFTCRPCVLLSRVIHSTPGNLRPPSHRPCS